MSVAHRAHDLRHARACRSCCPTTCKGQVHLLGRDFPTYRVFLISFVGADHRRRCGSASSARAGARWCAPRSTTAPWRSRSASTPAPVHGSPSRSAAASPAWAARSAPTSCRCSLDLSVRAPRLLPDRRRGRRPRQPARAVRRRAAHRHRRHRVQVLGARVRRVPRSTPRRSAILLWRPQGLFGSAARMTAHPAAIAADPRIRWTEWLPWIAAHRVLLPAARVPRARRAHPDLHPVRAVARPDPRLRRHHHARPSRVLRPRRLHRRRPRRQAGVTDPFAAARRRRASRRRCSASPPAR